MPTPVHIHWLLVAVAYLGLNIPLALVLGRMIKIGQHGDQPPNDPFRQPPRRASLARVPNEADGPA